MSRVVLSVGSNLGDRLAHLQDAVTAFRADLVAVSSVYRTAPWGPVPQDDFLNIVVLAARQGRSPHEWWALAQAAEQAAGRTREVRWGPRTLDVDLVGVWDDDGAALTISDLELTLPHPRAGERGFVLIPWLEVDPQARLAGTAVSELVGSLPESERAGVRHTGLSVAP